MPGGDRTGPAGMGPMSGRAGGYCAGYSAPGFNNPGSGRFMGAGRGSFGGRGRGAGYRNWYRATGRPGWSRYDTGMPARGGTAGVPYYRDNYPLQDMDPGEEAEMLKQQTDYLKQQINDIKDRIKELSKDQQSS